MFAYFVLWIPVRQKGDLKIINPKLDDIIPKDLPDALDLHIKGYIDRNTYDITFEYWLSKEDKNTYIFKCLEKNPTGFIVYQVEIEDSADDYVSESLRNGLHKSYYHYIKGFFHDHVHHDKIEDSLLDCYSSQSPISLKDKQILREVVDSYLNCYIRKLRGIVREAQIHLGDLLDEMSQGKNVTKNIKFLHALIKNCYCIDGELGYCRFLSNTNINDSSRKKRQELAAARVEFDNAMDELLFWYNHYMSLVSYTDGGKSLKWGMAGVAVGVFSLVGTAILEYLSYEQPTHERQLEYIDSLNRRHVMCIDQKIDSLHVVIKQEKERDSILSTPMNI